MAGSTKPPACCTACSMQEANQRSILPVSLVKLQQPPCRMNMAGRVHYTPPVIQAAPSARQSTHSGKAPWEYPTRATRAHTGRVATQPAVLAVASSSWRHKIDIPPSNSERCSASPDGFGPSRATQGKGFGLWLRARKRQHSIPWSHNLEVTCRSEPRH